MTDTLQHLREAEAKAALLFRETEQRGLIQPGKTEKQLNDEVFELAFALFGIRKFWHKRIVRSGRNTLLPYRENPPDLVLQEDDILFFDFGPVFDEWEADLGRTYVLGQNQQKQQLAKDVATAWEQGKAYFEQHRDTITAAAFYRYTSRMAEAYGWTYGNEHCGHLVGNFPHEQLIGDDLVHYLHPDNETLMKSADRNGNPRHWIYEIHFTDQQAGIGGFFEQLLC